VSWSVRLGLDSEGEEQPATAATVAAALLRDAKRVAPSAGGQLNESEIPPQPLDSYVENRHSQIRRRESSGGHLASLAHESPRSSRTRSSTTSSMHGHRGAYVCPALPSHPTTPHQTGHAGDPDALLYSPRSVSSLQALSVEEFDEELDSSMPSPPVRIPQAKPLLSLKPFALPPPAQ